MAQAPAERYARIKAWRVANPERVRQILLRYRESLQKKCAADPAFAAATKARIAAQPSQQRATVLARVKRWQATHPEQVKAHGKQNRQRHPEVHRAAERRRRATRAHASVNDFTAAQWQEMKAAYGYRCVYYQRKMQRLTQDHITPLSKGGSHTAANIVPACWSCNSKKQAGAPLRPVQPILLTLAPALRRKEDGDVP